MAEERWHVFGASMGEAIEYVVLYLGLFGAVVIVTLSVVLLYACRKARQKAEGIDPKTCKANTGWRIAVTILLILCLVLLLPVAYLSIFG